ncbi:MAG: histidine phosphatase family protein [Planctomycetales bacterium]|nr:histidine phosphatase family protein [Planctomycetales bacterium]
MITTRRLIIMRHAKSDWSTDATSDHQRPLNKRGRRDAPRIAQELAARGWVPDYVVSSDSSRTRETFERMAPFFDDELQADFLYALYHAGLSELSDVLFTVDDSYESILALGHNPGWQEAVSWLSGQFGIPMSTANAALLEIEADTWRGGLQQAGHWTLVDVIRPKELD